jgi:hypothetical protein
MIESRQIKTTLTYFKEPKIKIPKPERKKIDLEQEYQVWYSLYKALHQDLTFNSWVENDGRGESR